MEKDRKRKWTWSFLGVVVVLVNFASNSWAEFNITPSIGVREEYNDNIFLTPSNKQSDFITTISPLISLGYKTRSLTLSLDYGLEFRLYARHPDENQTSPTNTQTARLENTVSLYKDIVQLKVLDQYQRVPIDVRNQVAIGNYIVNMTDSNLLLVNPYMLYPLSGSLKARLGYTYTNQWYRDRSLDRYQSHTFEAGLIKDLNSQITATATYDYITSTHTTQLDYTRQNAIAGITYQMTPRWSFNGSLGETWFNFQEGGTLSTLSDPIWSVSTKYDVTSRLSLSGEYLENYADSSNAGVIKRGAATAGIAYNGQIPVFVTAMHERDKYLETAREDKWTGVSVSTSKPLTPKMTARLMGIYTYYTFLPQDEKVKRYGVDAALDYVIKITTLTLGYTYNRNNSTINANDYSNNIIYVQARFVL